MMSLNAAFYQILFQNEMLFQVAESTAGYVQEEFVQEPHVRKAPEDKAPMIQVVEIPKPEPAKPGTDFPALNHKILLLVDEPKQPDLVTSEALFLDNILKAVGYSSEHSDLLNFSFLPGQDARKVLSEKRTHFFITFGVPLIKLHLDLLLIPYTPKLVEGVWFLLTDPLVVIEADRNLKKKLWQALQKMFETP